MKYNINIDSVVFWEGASISLETEPGETEDLTKATKEIYSTLMSALQPMMQQSMMPTSSYQSTCHCSSTTGTSETSFKEVEKEEEKPEEEKPAKKEKKIAVD